ncbi:hypothetical protein CMUS01_01925 [Colletotrichum musicola]|uniref:Uncharacterized protein n=1 Tax=Colletotrichum musicola TaxID=2175873 RepID=A0A8H6U7L2_9PEZI|nr:hypothetical protein CMUS01_01925 [Colletotrichum musicola]
MESSTAHTTTSHIHHHPNVHLDTLTPHTTPSLAWCLSSLHRATLLGLSASAFHPPAVFLSSTSGCLPCVESTLCLVFVLTIRSFIPLDSPYQVRRWSSSREPDFLRGPVKPVKPEEKTSSTTNVLIRQSHTQWSPPKVVVNVRWGISAPPWSPARRVLSNPCAAAKDLPGYAAISLTPWRSLPFCSSRSDGTAASTQPGALSSASVSALHRLDQARLLFLLLPPPPPPPPPLRSPPCLSFAWTAPVLLMRQCHADPGSAASTSVLFASFFGMPTFGTPLALTTWNLARDGQDVRSLEPTPQLPSLLAVHHQRPLTCIPWLVPHGSCPKGRRLGEGPLAGVFSLLACRSRLLTLDGSSALLESPSPEPRSRGPSHLAAISRTDGHEEKDKSPSRHSTEYPAVTSTECDVRARVLSARDTRLGRS